MLPPINAQDPRSRFHPSALAVPPQLSAVVSPRRSPRRVDLVSTLTRGFNKRTAKIESQSATPDVQSPRTERAEPRSARGGQHQQEAVCRRPSDGLGGRDDAAFAEVVQQIDALCGGAKYTPAKSKIKPLKLKKNTPHEDICTKNGYKHYLVTLPSKPAKIVVTVAKIIGSAAWENGADQQAEAKLRLYGSVENERPDEKDHEYVEEDALEYIHAYTRPTMGPDGNPVHRLKVVPPYTNFYVSVSVAKIDCRFCIRWSIQKVNIKLTKDELCFQARTAFSKELVPSSPVGLDLDESEVQEMMVRCKRYEEEKKQKRKEQAGKDFVELNQDLKRRVVPPAKRRKEVRKKREAVNERQMTLMKAKQEKRVEWAMRRERYAQQREEKEKEQHMAAERAQRASTWLLYLMLNMQSCIWTEKYQQKRAVNLIKANWMRIYSRRRRQNVYRNAVMLRIGFAASVRLTRLAVQASAAMCVVKFLQMPRSGHGMELTNCARRFRARVVLLQRRFRQLKLLRASRVEAFRRLFRIREPVILSKLGFGKDRAPKVIVDHVLRDLVRRQQLQWISAWTFFKKLQAKNSALATFTRAGEDDDVERPRMYSFTLNNDELDNLISSTHKRWRNGSYQKLLLDAQVSEEVEEEIKEPQGEQRKGSKRGSKQTCSRKGSKQSHSRRGSKQSSLKASQKVELNVSYAFDTFFELRKAEWCESGNWVCKHGVFFESSREGACTCVGNQTSLNPSWTGAAWMPCLDSSKRALSVIPFESMHVVALEELVAEAKRQGW